MFLIVHCRNHDGFCFVLVVAYHPPLHVIGALRYSVGSSGSMRLLTMRKFDTKLGVVCIHVIAELMTFKDDGEPQTIYCKSQGSMHTIIQYIKVQIVTSRIYR